MRPTLFLIGGLLFLSLASASCGCNRCNKMQPPKEGILLQPGAFSLSSLSDFIQMRDDAALGQHSDGESRLYSHHISTDSSGAIKQVTHRQLGDRAVTDEQVGSRTTRKLHNIEESDVARFDAQWRSSQRADPALSDAKRALIGDQSQRKACVKQEHPNGAKVEVMLLGPGEHESSQWAPAIVKRMSCDGKYQLLTPHGQRVQPALSTGIEHRHLRQQTDPEPEDPFEARLKAAEKALKDAQEEVALEKSAKKAQAQKIKHVAEKAAKKQAAKQKVAQIDAEIQEAEKAFSAARKKMQAELQAASEVERSLAKE